MTTQLLALAGGGGVNATDVASRSIGAYFRGKVEYSTGKVDSFPEYVASRLSCMRDRNSVCRDILTRTE